MTRADNRQQNAERRLRHATWARDPGFPWSGFILAMFAAVFLLPLLMRTH